MRMQGKPVPFGANLRNAVWNARSLSMDWSIDQQVSGGGNRAISWSCTLHL